MRNEPGTDIHGCRDTDDVPALPQVWDEAGVATEEREDLAEHERIVASLVLVEKDPDLLGVEEIEVAL